MANGVGRAALLAALVHAGAFGCGEDGGAARGGGLGQGSGPDAAAQADAGSQADAATESQADAEAPRAHEFSAFDEALNGAIADYNQTAPQNKKLRGASAVVVHRERGVVYASGYLQYGADRVYLLASASKILSVGVLMRLADQGLLDLDAAIHRYLPDWSESGAGEVTVAQLLSNSSGLASLAEVSSSLTGGGPYSAQGCQYLFTSVLGTCGQAIYGAEPPRAPDTTFAYGGSQWQLAGALAERVSGKSWAQLVRETYVEPCGTESLGYTNHFLRALDPLWYPAFFSGDVAALPVTENPSIEGGGYMTAPDYGKLLLMHLRGGTCGDQRVLSEDAVARMQTERVRSTYNATVRTGYLPGTWGYGLGWFVNEEQQLLVDPGAYGAVALLDQKREYGAFIALEASSMVGTSIALRVKPALDAIFDAAP